MQKWLDSKKEKIMKKVILIFLIVLLGILLGVGAISIYSKQNENINKQKETIETSTIVEETVQTDTTNSDSLQLENTM